MVWAGVAANHLELLGSSESSHIVGVLEGGLRTRLRECCLPCCGSDPGLPVATFVVVALPMVALMALVIYKIEHLLLQQTLI